MLCNECKTKDAVATVSFVTQGAVQPVCNDCMVDIGHRYKSDWSGSQIVIRPLFAKLKKTSRKLGWWVRVKEFFFPCRMRRVVNKLIKEGKIRPRKEWSTA